MFDLVLVEVCLKYLVKSSARFYLENDTDSVVALVKHGLSK